MTNDGDAGLAWEVLQRYRDPATVEFDAVLAGTDLPDDVLRALRFWQRESVANVKQYASEALPAVFAAVARAQEDAAEATRNAGAVLGHQASVRTGLVITLPDAGGGNAQSAVRLEERRRTVAARLAELAELG